MNAEAQRLWTEALLSGEYKQGARYLNMDGCMCVMGVLCDVYAKLHKIEGPWMVFMSGPQNRIKKGFLNRDSIRMPPHEVLQWAGLTTKKGKISDKGELLIQMNDSGASFQRLAETINQTFPAKG